MNDAEFYLERYTVCMEVFAAAPFDSPEATYWRARAKLAYDYWQRAVAEEIPQSAPAVPVDERDAWL